MTGGAEYVEGLPNISGSEAAIEEEVRRSAGQVVFARSEARPRSRCTCTSR
jgi:hypothetical protein